MIAANTEMDGGLATAGFSSEDGTEGGELCSQLPFLHLAEEDAESGVSRRIALRRLDDLLDRLERGNLADRRRPSSAAVRELAARGLPNPLIYTTPELIEIVFKTQGVLMRANRSAHRPVEAGDDADWGEQRGRHFII